MKRFWRRLHPTQPSAGFSLVELLIAMAVTGIMLAMAGYGLTTLMRANLRSDTEVTQRTNLNRALDFMANEIRMARAVSLPAASAIPTQVCGSTQGVVQLTRPDNSTVIYYVHNISRCTNTLWAGPATIRRVQGGTDVLLVDGLIAPGTLPRDCATGSRSLAGTDGFYACLDSLNPRLTTLYLFGQLTNASGVVTGTYPVSSQISTRSF